MGMQSETDGPDAFEAALSPEAYTAAWRYAWYLSRNREDAQDLLQDALALAFVHHAQLRNAAHFTGWLLSIVRRTHLAHLRRARPISGAGPKAQPQDAAGGQDEPSCAGLAALPPRLAAALLKLPAAQREVLELYYIHELGLSEVGRVLGLGPGAVKLRLFRARGALRRKLGVGLGCTQDSAAGACDGLA